MKKRKCEKERLPIPIFGVLGVNLGPDGGPGGSQNCEKGASGGYQKKLEKKRRFEKTADLKDFFEKHYFEWLKDNHKDVHKDLTGRDYKEQTLFIKSQSLMIMARLIELGVFAKEPGTRYGPYYLVK